MPERPPSPVDLTEVAPDPGPDWDTTHGPGLLDYGHLEIAFNVMLFPNENAYGEFDGWRMRVDDYGDNKEYWAFEDLEDAIEALEIVLANPGNFDVDLRQFGQRI